MEIYTCPYWTWTRKKWESCEGAWLRFPSTDCHDAYIAKYCANVKNWKNCSFSKHLTEDWEKTEAKCGDFCQK